MYSAIHAKQNKSSVVYYLTVGDTIRELTKKGGSLSWRCNNPGNLRVSDNQIAEYRNDNGRYAIFPDAYTGLKALEDLLKSDVYNKLTVAEVIAKYAPSNDGNPVKNYIKRVCEDAGCRENDKLSALDVIRFNKIVQSIIVFEGYLVGSMVQRRISIQEFQNEKSIRSGK